MVRENAAVTTLTLKFNHPVDYSCEEGNFTSPLSHASGMRREPFRRRIHQCVCLLIVNAEANLS